MASSFSDCAINSSKKDAAFSESCDRRKRCDLCYLRNSSLSGYCLNSLLVFLVIFLFGCATLHPIPQEQDARHSFRAFPKKYRKLALEYERLGELRRALICWQIVDSFKPDNEVSARINMLRAKTLTMADEHFSKGVAYLRNSEKQRARGEFLKALNYDPDHEQALDYLLHEVRQPHFLVYETKEHDSLKKIAGDKYDDSSKDYIVAYFNDIDSSTKLEPGVKLKLPFIEVPLTAEPTHTEDMLHTAQALFKTRQYQKAVLRAKDILTYDPTNNEAAELLNASCYQLGRELIRKKQYVQALRLFEGLDSNYRNVSEIKKLLRKNLNDKAEAHYKKGLTYFLGGELDRAIEEWQEALLLNPDHPRAKRDLKKAQRLSNNLKRFE